MKTMMKKMLSVLLGALCCTGCLDVKDHNDDYEILYPMFYGDLTVEPIPAGTPEGDTEGDENEGDGQQPAEEAEESGEEQTPGRPGGYGAYYESDVPFQLLPTDSNHQTAILYMPRIKFSEMMPVYISFAIRNLVDETPLNPLTFIFSIDETMPEWNNAPYDPNGDGSYKITNLEGRYSKENMEEVTLHVEFDCKGMHVTYHGTWDKDSLEF